MNTHDDLRWIDGRRVETDRVFPTLQESRRWPDWTWSVEDFDLGDPCQGYFATEVEALEDAKEAIAERRAEMTEPEPGCTNEVPGWWQEPPCPDADQHSELGCRTCGLEPLSEF